MDTVRRSTNHTRGIVVCHAVYYDAMADLCDRGVRLFTFIRWAVSTKQEDPKPLTLSLGAHAN